MKCPNCNKNHKYSGGMTCSCGYHFVFDPKADRITDGKFAAAITLASRNGTYDFTANQLYTAFNRKHRQKSGCFLVALFIAVVTAVGGFAAGIVPLAMIGAAVALVSLALLAANAANPNLKRSKFDALLLRWTARQKIPQLVDKPAMHQPPPQWPEKDIYDYGAERILVVQHDLLVDLLVRNHFHAEQSCVVVSINHYPSYIWTRVEAILQTHKPVKVFLLHDASTLGLQVMERFKASHAPLLGQANLIDLGLFPGDAQRIEPLKALNLKKNDPNVPVDAIPYAHLQGLTAQAMEEGTTMHTVLITRPQGNDYISDNGGSVG